MYNVQHVSTDL